MEQDENTNGVRMRPQRYDASDTTSNVEWHNRSFDPKKGPEYMKDRRGVGIGIITRGQVPIKWMMHMNRQSKFTPGGLHWKYIIVERMSWAAARSEVVRKCRAMNFEWLFFVDDDVFIPHDALDRLLRSGKKVISGVYWTKTENTAPVIFKKMGGGPMYDFEVDKIIPIAGSGLGCCLIHMSVFDKFDEEGIPYFVENWVYTAPDGNRMKCPIGEDHYFFIKAKELGFQPYAHTGVLCDHYDVKKDKFYPGKKIVRELCGEKLKKEGREEIIEQQKRAVIDPDKKTVVFYNRGAPFSGDEIERRGVGGSESDIIYLARQFKLKGFNVHVFCECLRPGVYDGIWYHHHKEFKREAKGFGGIDLLIVSRNAALLGAEPDLRAELDVDKLVLWGHDMAEDPHWDDFGQLANKFDKVVMLSESHRDNLFQRFPKLKQMASRFIIIGDAVDDNLYDQDVDKVKGRCIYSSTTYRGLDILLSVWPKIKQRVPHATLHIFSSIKTYSEHFDDSPWEHLYAAAHRMDGVKMHGSVRKKRLAKEQLQSQLLLYPNTFKETYCITAAECITAGTPIITTKLGALPETIPEGCGILLDGPANKAEYQQKFIDNAVELLTNDQKWEQMHKECLKHDFSWNTRIKEWLQEFFPGVSKTETTPEPTTVSKDVIGDTNKERDEFFKSVEDKENYGEHEAKFNLFKQFMNPDDKVLVVNCGFGALPRYLKTNYPQSEVWGTEESMYALDYCRQSSKKIFFANHPITNPEYEPEYFDVIYMEGLPVNKENEERIMKQLEWILKPKGVIVASTRISEMNPNDVVEFFARYGATVTFHSFAGPELVISARWNT